LALVQKVTGPAHKTVVGGITRAAARGAITTNSICASTARDLNILAYSTRGASLACSVTVGTAGLGDKFIGSTRIASAAHRVGQRRAGRGYEFISRTGFARRANTIGIRRAWPLSPSAAGSAGSASGTLGVYSAVAHAGNEFTSIASCARLANGVGRSGASTHLHCIGWAHGASLALQVGIDAAGG